MKTIFRVSVILSLFFFFSCYEIWGPLDNPLDYSVGDIGPAGGVVFYDKGEHTDGWRFLEAAPVSTEWSSKAWGGWGTSVGGTGVGIGTGAANTQAIVSAYGTAEPYAGRTDYAAKLCADLSHGGYSDWFLPSKDELSLMYQQRGVSGGFESANYWSSSEDNAYNAWGQVFGSGSQYSYGKNDVGRVRAARGF